MKKFNFLLISLLISSLQLKAQSPELLDNTWYLENVTISDIVYFAPDNAIIEYAEFYNNFFETQSSCNFFSSVVNFNNEDSNFTMIEFSLTLEDCLDDNIAIFEEIYLIKFINYPSSDFNNPFTYEINEETSTLKKLTITNTNGDKAVYYSETLSTNDVNNFGSVKLYPNPAQNEFSIESDLALEQIKVYNELGQVVAMFNAIEVQSSYDISKLSNGLYFVEVTSLEGKKTVRKLIKNFYRMNTK